MKKNYEKELDSYDTFEVHEKMFKERLREIKEDGYMDFEDLVKSANTSIVNKFI